MMIARMSVCCVSDFLVVYTRGRTDVDGEVTTLNHHITSQGLQVTSVHNTVNRVLEKCN